MSYRARLGKVSKKEKEKFDGKSFEEVEKMIGKEMYAPDFHTQLFGIGKEANYEHLCTSFFSFDTLLEEEFEFYVMEKDGLKEIINDYHNQVLDHYTKLKDQPDRYLVPFIHCRIQTWSKEFDQFPYYLDRDPDKCDGFIVSSDYYEYAIFNLVYIYRSFDWENDYLIYSAW